jgi:DNA segregation ATPase FtsK/SpoIIIE-like protein
MAGEGGTVIEGEVRQLPAPGDTTPTEEELQQYYELGYQAAKDGKPESDCPIVRSELVIEWVRGFKAFHEEQAGSDSTANEPEDGLYEKAVELVRAEKRVSISMVQRALQIGYNRAARLVEAMEQKGVVSAANENGQRTVISDTGE